MNTFHVDKRWGIWGYMHTWAYYVLLQLFGQTCNTQHVYIYTHTQQASVPRTELCTHCQSHCPSISICWRAVLVRGPTLQMSFPHVHMRQSVLVCISASHAPHPPTCVSGDQCLSSRQCFTHSQCHKGIQRPMRKHSYHPWFTVHLGNKCLRQQTADQLPSHGTHTHKHTENL